MKRQRDDTCKTITTRLAMAIMRKESVASIQPLIDQGANVNITNHDGHSMLMLACERSDDEAPNVVSLLLHHGAVANHKPQSGSTAFLYACDRGHVLTVAVLLSYGADLHDVVPTSQKTALMLACTNKQHGAAIVDYLLSKTNIDKDARDASGKTALPYAFCYNAEALRVMEKYYEAGDQLANYFPSQSNGDPLGSMRIAEKYGFAATQQRLKALLKMDRPTQVVQSFLRLAMTDGTIEARSVIRCLGRHHSSMIWKSIAIEIGINARSDCADTLLHHAVNEGHGDAVQALLPLWPNPFLRDFKDKTPLDSLTLPTNAAMRALLAAYMARPPSEPPRREVLRWYGPMLFLRARAFLLVVQRWRVQGVRVVPRDVVHMIIRHVRLGESV